MIDNKVYYIGPDDLYNKEDNLLYEIKSIEDCLEWIKDKDSIALDTETEGFFNHKNRIIMLQLSDGKDVWVIDTRANRDYFSKLKPYLESKLILGQNLKFDYKFLKFEGVELENIYDTFLAECILTNGKEWLIIKEGKKPRYGRQLGLGEITKRYCNATLNKSIRNQFIGLNGQPFTHKQIVYGSEDVLYLHPIRSKQNIRADKYQLHEIIELENKACLAIADIEYNGIKLDINKWLELAKNVDSRIPEYEIELDNLVLNNPKLISFINTSPQLDIFGGVGRKVNISWSSPIQVTRLLRILLNKQDLEGSNEKEIAIYQYDYPLIKKFIDYKKDAKLASTYGDSFVKFINPVTGRVHGEFWQILNTFRVSCGGDKDTGKSAVNLQNLPAKNEYLNCFIAEKGKKIVGIDYKAQEGRIAACFSKDRVWLDTFINEKDLHGEVCKMMFGITDDLVKTYPEFLRGKSYRDVAKTINFMALFGGTKWKLSKVLQVSLEEADDLLKKYFAATEQLQGFLDKCAKYGLKFGYIRTGKPYSGIRWFPKWKLNLDSYKDSKIIGDIIRACYNTPVQGTAAIMTKLALIYIRKYIKDNKLQDKVKLIHVVHDATYTEVDENFAKEFSTIQSNLMIDAGKPFVEELQMLTDITIADYWKK